MVESGLEIFPRISVLPSCGDTMKQAQQNLRKVLMGMSEEFSELFDIPISTFREIVDDASCGVAREGYAGVEEKVDRASREFFREIPDSSSCADILLSLKNFLASKRFSDDL